MIDNYARLHKMDSKLQELGSIEDISRFGNPEEYIETGYSVHKQLDDELRSKQNVIVTNENCESYLVRTKFFEPDSNKYTKAYESGVIYRTFTEIDLYQLISIENQIKLKQRINKIDSCTILSLFRNQSMFSIFYKEYYVYQ